MCSCLAVALVLRVLLGIVLGAGHSSGTSTQRQKSLAKWGSIVLRSCAGANTNTSDPFPLDRPAATWASCDDAYDYTWSVSDDDTEGDDSGYLNFTRYSAMMAQQYYLQQQQQQTAQASSLLPLDAGFGHRYIRDLSPESRLKLIRSTGFCPHRRCQLGDAGNSSPAEHCAAGLCYTKLEAGAPSFGACCFTGGLFDSGDLVGVYGKTQPTPKPIYRHSRVVLRPSTGDRGGPECDMAGEGAGVCAGENEARYALQESFVNANEVLPGLILTQCPLTALPSAPLVFQSTVGDVQRMVLQQGVSLWIQLMKPEAGGAATVADWPVSAGAGVGGPPAPPVRTCELFPLLPQLEAEPVGGMEVRVQVEHLHRGVHGHPATRSVDGFCSARSAGGDQTPPLCLQDYYSNISVHYSPRGGGGIASHRLQFLWYGDWVDFGVPPTPQALPSRTGNHAKGGGEDGGPWTAAEVDAHDETIRLLARRAADEMRGGRVVVLSCMSGRGRSGTLAAVIAGYLHGLEEERPPSNTPLGGQSEEEHRLREARVAAKLDRLVDIIVTMRGRRDGLVELPAQFHYARRILGLL